MTGLWVVPLALSAALVSPLLVERVSPTVRLRISQVALALFGDHVGVDDDRRLTQQAKLRAAHVGTTHRVYASRTLLYSLLLGVSGSVVGVYAAAVLLWALRVGGSTIRERLPAGLAFLADLTRVTQLGVADLFVLLLASSATLGAALAAGSYVLRWRLLEQRAQTRAGAIEATLPRTIAFVYALSRSGMAFPAVLETLSANRDVYGEAAVEVGVAVREMNTFRTDVVTALDRLADRTPSERMREFGENLGTVLASGQPLSTFLHEQYRRHQEEAESLQAQYLDLLSTFAETYVTLLVAGPLFLITTLAVVGLVLQDTLRLLRLVVYLGVPIASLGFVLYIDRVTGTLADAVSRDSDVDLSEAAGDSTEFARSVDVRADGGRTTDGWQASRERLATYETFERVVGWLRRPWTSVRRTPSTTFLATVPLGLAWIALRVDSVPSTLAGALRTVDGPFVTALLFALAVFAGVHELERRRVRAIERVVPDFLDRVASTNAAGASVVDSFRRLAGANLGALSPELDRLWRDVQWGADLRTALRRLDERTRSATVTRATTLAANAMSVSGDIAPVLEIAADEARATRRLRRERRREMLTYLLVIYVSFLVYLGIVAALSVSFIPAIETAGLGGARANGLPEQFTTGPLSDIRSVDTAAYELVFFHAAVIQALCSGLVAGQLGEGRVADGAKHAVALLALTLVAFLAI